MSSPDRDMLERVKAVLSEHPVRFAMVFGSTARGDDDRESDVDIAVEFENEPTGDDYSDTYLDLVTDLEDALGTDVEVVTFRSMTPPFAGTVLEHGVVVVGDEERRAAIERRTSGIPPSTSEARERVAAVARRLSGTDD